MFPFRKSLGFRLLVISVILLAFPLLLDSFILVHRRYRDAAKDAKNYLMEVANVRNSKRIYRQVRYAVREREVVHEAFGAGSSVSSKGSCTCGG